jgi:hypothetical protein
MLMADDIPHQITGPLLYMPDIATVKFSQKLNLLGFIGGPSTENIDLFYLRNLAHNSERIINIEILETKC